MPHAAPPLFSDLNPVFIPGPTNVPDRLRRAMDMQTRDHRAPDFASFFLPVLEDTKKVFATETGKVILFPSSGTGGWEAALSNTLSPGDTVLVADYGMFSHRWIDMCKRHGLDVQVLDCAWGTGAPAERFAEALSADKAHKIKAVLLTHNETATGVKSDVAAVRRAIDASNHPALYFVDCVSSLGSMDFRMDEWGVDIAISGSQKGFMLNMGLAVIAVSSKALDAMDAAKLPRTFFDFRDMLGANAKGSFPYTPPIQLINGMRTSLDMLFAEGLPNVYARHARLAEGVRRAVTAWDMRLVAETPELYSDSVSAILLPEGTDGNALIGHAYAAYGTSFGAGLGQLAGKAFRIGHLGALTEGVVLSGLATIEMAMADKDVPITLGAGVAAAQDYYRNSRSAALRKVA
jgi:alanine-glyoxylate transaminase/serine-glyoxylate transaminase/serine-pyruvate transaminase